MNCNRDDASLILPVLRNFDDSLTIYRSTLESQINCNENHMNLEENKFKIIQILENTFYVSKIFQDLITDMETEGNYEVIIREIEDERQKEEERLIVVSNYTEARMKIDELRKLVQEEKITNAAHIQQLRKQHAGLENEHKRLMLKVNIESKYVRALEKARCENISVQCDVAVESLKEGLKNISWSDKNEERVAKEMAAFLEHNSMANENAANKWEERYESEMQIYENENERLKDEIENKRQTFAKLECQYSEQRDFIAEYLAEKEIAIELNKLEEHRRKCSIKIQSWWRGVMVRRKLGPYRPDEKKKKRAAKTKK